MRMEKSLGMFHIKSKVLKQSLLSHNVRWGTPKATQIVKIVAKIYITHKGQRAYLYVQRPQGKGILFVTTRDMISIVELMKGFIK